MNGLLFKEVTEENFETVIKLSDTLDAVQKQCVASNLYSIAESTLHPDNAYYRVVYKDDTPIGFFMLYIPDKGSISEGDTDFFLWRLMISKPYQKQGYGKKVLDEIINIAKARAFDEVLLSCNPIEGGPLKFYLKYGFFKDGKMYDDEVGLRYKIDD